MQKPAQSQLRTLKKKTLNNFLCLSICVHGLFVSKQEVEKFIFENEAQSALGHKTELI